MERGAAKRRAAWGPWLETSPHLVGHGAQEIGLQVERKNHPQQAQHGGVEQGAAGALHGGGDQAGWATDLRSIALSLIGRLTSAANTPRAMAMVHTMS